MTEPRKKRGRPKGSKNRPNSARSLAARARGLSKEQAREDLRKLIFAELEPMTRAQIAKAKGYSYLVARQPNGIFRRLKKAPDEGERVGEEGDIVEVWHEEPSTPAFTDLMNRAIDKAIEPQQVDLTVNASEKVLAALQAGRERAAKGK